MKRKRKRKKKMTTKMKRMTMMKMLMTIRIPGEIANDPMERDRLSTQHMKTSNPSKKTVIFLSPVPFTFAFLLN